MKKVTFTNSKGLDLVGLLHKSNRGSDSIVVLCHGLADDKSERGRFDVISQILEKEGYNVFRFDLAGHGESADYEIYFQQGVEDLNSTLRYLINNKYRKIDLIGYCSGALICLKNLIDEVNSMVLVSPLTDIKEDFIGRLDESQLNILAEHERLNYKMQGTWRDEIIISSKLLEEIYSIDQEELLSKVNIPTLIIHGSLDEQIPLYKSKSAISLIKNPDSKLIIIDGMDHSFLYKINEVTNYILDWLHKYSDGYRK